MKKLILFVILILTSFILFSLEPGDKAPNFANPDVHGNFHFSKSYFTKGWVLLDFFATWCEPCKEKLPQIAEIEEEYYDKGLTTIVFAIDKEGPEVVVPFFKENPVNSLVLIDRYQVTIKDKYKETSIPLYFLVDEEGIIRYKGNDVDSIKEILEQQLIE